MRVLVVEDSAKMAGLLGKGLARQGYAVDVAGCARDAIWMATEHDYDAIVLDVILEPDGPGMDGFEVCRRLRTARRWAPVLMVTARDSVQDRVRGLDVGADDYLPKPFSPQELVLRVGAVLRRLAAPAIATGGLVTAGPIALDRGAHRVTVDAAEIELTATEFKLLRTLIEREGRVQSRAQLLETVWQAHPDIQTRTVDMHVQRLRQKLGKAGDCIETVRGAGYRFRRPPPEPRGRKRS